MPLHIPGSWCCIRRRNITTSSVSSCISKMALERSPNQRWRRRSIPQLMTAHVFLICLIFRSSLSPDSGAKPTVSPRFQRKVGDTTTVAAWKMSRRRHDARSQSADGTVGRLQRRPLMMIDGWSSKHFLTRKPSRCSVEDRGVTTRPCHLSLLG